MPEQLHAEPKVHILEIAEKIIIEPSGLRPRFFTVKTAAAQAENTSPDES
jgi:hypothetical protein